MITVVKLNKNILRNQNGQSLFEFIIFVPFLVFFYTIFYTAGNSINGSINQQKAVRGYYYSLVKGNSYLLTFNDLENLKNFSINTAGFFGIGWFEHQTGNQRFAPCFEFNSILKNNTTEKCDGQERDIPGSSSRFVRIFTYYGVCGATYTLSSKPLANGRYEFDFTHQTGSCILAK